MNTNRIVLNETSYFGPGSRSVIPEEVKNQMYDYAQIIQELDKKMMDLNTIVQKYKKEF